MQRKTKQKQYCNGVRTSGYWKGNKCCAVVVLKTNDGKYWCKNHVPINETIVRLNKKNK